jgi:mitochondrial ATPase complex subunit ATP10
MCSISPQQVLSLKTSSNYGPSLTPHRTAQVARPYFRDWTNMRYQKGKVFIAPERIFRADKALFFPNLRGITAADDSKEHDTTAILRGGISVVSVYTGTWAQQQTEMFVEKNDNLQKMLRVAKAATSAGAANDSKPSSAETTSPSAADASHDPAFLQHVRLNVEPNRMRHAIVKLFLSRQRRALPETEWSRYFVVHKGFDQRLRERLGMFNSQVGYVFLVDAACRIRWAGSAEAEESEVQSLNRAVVRLVREYQKLLQEKEKLLRDGEKEFSALDFLGDVVLRSDVVEGALRGMVELVEG